MENQTYMIVGGKPTTDSDAHLRNGESRPLGAYHWSIRKRNIVSLHLAHDCVKAWNGMTQNERQIFVVVAESETDERNHPPTK